MQPTPVSIRRARAEDAPAIASLYGELVSDPNIQVLPEQIERLANSPDSFLLVAEADQMICATALLTLCRDVMFGTQPFGVLENIVVTQARRGQGIGHHLLTEIEQLALTHDCSKLMLLSSTTRHEAHAFFRHHGFADGTKKAFVKYRRQFTTS